jgi:hypothetical protein
VKRSSLLLSVVVALLAGATLAPRAVGVLPRITSGTSVGEGVPLKAYATLAPQVHLFGDVVTARLAVVADTKWVDPARLRATTDFKPYRLVHPPLRTWLRAGRFQQVTWTWTLRCITTECVPRRPSEQFHVFRFQTIHVEYIAPNGKPAYGIDATWPRVEVVSQVSPGVVSFLKLTKRLAWQFRLAPVATPTYRISPTLLFWSALGAGIALLAAATILTWRWYRSMRPRLVYGGPASAAASQLERALAVLAWAHARGDETLERKALERVAGELDVETPEEVDDLSRKARELAWSSHSPEDDEVETLSERARGTGRIEDVTEDVTE